MSPPSARPNQLLRHGTDSRIQPRHAVKKVFLPISPTNASSSSPTALGATVLEYSY
jgi:hypothetical protein